jgi:hypothetical protein
MKTRHRWVLGDGEFICAKCGIIRIKVHYFDTNKNLIKGDVPSCVPKPVKRYKNILSNGKKYH